MHRYIVADIPNKRSRNSDILERIIKHISRHGAVTRETIQLLCGRNKPGVTPSPTSFFREAIKKGWIIPEKIVRKGDEDDDQP